MEIETLKSEQEEIFKIYRLSDILVREKISKDCDENFDGDKLYLLWDETSVLKVEEDEETKRQKEIVRNTLLKNGRKYYKTMDAVIGDLFYKVIWTRQNSSEVERLILQTSTNYHIFTFPEETENLHLFIYQEDILFGRPERPEKTDKVKKEYARKLNIAERKDKIAHWKHSK